MAAKECMRMALEEARAAMAEGEVPVGCVLVSHSVAPVVELFPFFVVQSCLSYSNPKPYTLHPNP